MQTSVHIRLNNSLGQRFVKKLQDMGYSVMPNDKRSYFLHNPSDGRVLIEEEPSSDYVIKGFWPKYPNSEIVDLLEKTARAGKGDYYIDQNANGDEVSIINGVDAPQPSAAPAPAPQQQTQAPMQATQPAMSQNPAQPPQSNMDPEHYKTIMLDAISRITAMIAHNHFKPEDIYTQATRMQSASWIMAGLKAGFLDTGDVSQVMNDTKSAIGRIPQEIQNAVQSFQKKQQAGLGQAQMQGQGGVVNTTPQALYDQAQGGTFAPSSGMPAPTPPDDSSDPWNPGF